METYKEILEHTSAYRLQNNPDLQVKGNRVFKYSIIIKPLFENILRKEIPPAIPTVPSPPQLLIKPATFRPPSYSEIDQQKPSLYEDMSFQETAGESLMKFNRKNTEICILG